jgi:death on curing protein
MEIIFLTLQEVKIINFTQIDRYGGIYGIRDEKLLDSAINYPFAGFNQEYLHPDIYHMASAYMYAIIKNHPFLDGNKRTGFMTAIFFLAYNNITIIAEHDELFILAITIAESRISESEIAQFLKSKSFTY